MMVGGLELIIVDVRLRDGFVRFIGQWRGSMPPREVRKRTITIFGEDGQGIAQVDLDIGWDSPVVDGILTIDVPVKFTHMTAED
jgi:hypothetical protein